MAIIFNDLQDGQIALPNGRVRTTLRGRTRILGPRFQPSGALLLDDVHIGNNFSLLFKKKRKKGKT